MAPSRIPVRYLSLLTRQEGVEDSTLWNLYFGYLDASRQSSRQALGLATRPDNLIDMHLGLEKLDPAVVEALQREKTGAILSADIMQQMA